MPSKNKIEKRHFFRQSAKQYRFSKLVKYDIQRIVVIGSKCRGGIDCTS